MPAVERYRRMAREMLALANATVDSNLAEVFRKLADQYGKLAEAEEKLDRADSE
jgi:hypothetical protein